MEIILATARDCAGWVYSLDPARRARYERARDEYLAVKKAEAESQGSAPIVQPSGQILTKDKAHLLQWTTKFTKKTHRYFCCRQNSCRFFGLNIHWIDTVESGGWQFMCPCCMTQFRVGARGEHLTHAHYVWVTEGPAGPQYFLAEWPASAEENFNSKMLEIAEKSITEEMRSMPREAVQELILSTMQTKGRRTYFKEINFTGHAKVY